MTEDDAALSLLLSRRSVSPRRLAEPGPSRAVLNSLIGVALRAPDHFSLVPWRVIEFPRESRPALARVFEEEKLRRAPDATADDLARTREHAIHPPALLAFVFVPREHPEVPSHEQWLSAGGALGNLLMAVHVMGFGAKILSGARCVDRQLCAALGLTGEERLCGFVGIGMTSKESSAHERPARQQVLSAWPPSSWAGRSCG